jgi:hypothetical protein
MQGRKTSTEKIEWMAPEYAYCDWEERDRLARPQHDSDASHFRVWERRKEALSLLGGCLKHPKADGVATVS